MTDDYEDEDIVLSELPDDELVEQMHDDLYDGLAEEIIEGTQILLDRGWDAKRLLDEALVGVLADAQTSGGLLIAVAEDRAGELVAQLEKRQAKAAAVIGHIRPKTDVRVLLR